MREHLQADPSPWELIWLGGAMLEPLIAQHKTVEDLRRLRLPTTSSREVGWWIVGAWEAFCFRSDDSYLDLFLEVAANLLHRTESLRIRKTGLLARRPQDLETDLVIAQAWRVLGWANGARNRLDPSVFCENRFQQIRLKLAPLLSSTTDVRLLSLAKIWDLLPSGFPEAERYGSWADLVDKNSLHVDIVPWISIMRDQIGVRAFPFALGFVGGRPCDADSQKTIWLEEFSYNNARLDLQLSGCGQEDPDVRLDGRRLRRIYQDVSGIHRVAIHLSRRQ